MLQISVVIPTCRRPALLAQCLDALLEQDMAPERYEIIIVDDAHCQETKRLVESQAKAHAQKQPVIRYLPGACAHRPAGPAAARNLGWRAARGSIIAFTDDDCIPSRRWLSAGAAALVDGIDGVAGRLIVPLPDNPTDYEYNATGIAECDFVTANCFTAAWREDSDLSFTLLAHGAHFTNAPEAIVVHPIRPANWGVSVLQQRKSMFNALLYKKHPHQYKQKIQATPPWRYYSIIGTLLLAVMGLLKRSKLLVLLGLGLWTYQTGRFCMQRLTHTSREPGHVAEMVVTSMVLPPLAIFWRLRGAIKFRVWFL
jgi:glycosyltransferase involved in cell wall biosynthesis